MLAKSGLLRAASTSHHHHFHKSSRCFPTSVSEVLNFTITLHLAPQGPKGLGLRPHATLVSPPPLWLPLRVLVHLPPPSPPLSIFIPYGCFLVGRCAPALPWERSFHCQAYADFLFWCVNWNEVSKEFDGIFVFTLLCVKNIAPKLTTERYFFSCFLFFFSLSFFSLSLFFLSLFSLFFSLFFFSLLFFSLFLVSDLIV